MMRFNLLFLFPYVVLLIIFAISVSVLQKDQEKIKHITERQCFAERSMYAVISSGLRRRSKIELDAKLPPSEGNIKAIRANALSLEANEMDRVSRTLPNCSDH